MAGEIVANPDRWSNFPGAADTEAWRINSRGEIVDEYCLAHCDAFRIIEPTFIRIDVSGAVTTTAFDINAADDIVGIYRGVVCGPLHGWLLSRGGFTPIDQAHHIILVAQYRPSRRMGDQRRAAEEASRRADERRMEAARVYKVSERSYITRTGEPKCTALTSTISR